MASPRVRALNVCFLVALLVLAGGSLGDADALGTPKPLAEKLIGLDPPSTALDATAAIWRFFSRHHR